MKNFLFPHVFQAIGWILFVAGLIAGGLYFSSVWTPWTPTGIVETIVIDAAIISIAVGALFIVCSKERIEDEMTSSIRLSSILNSLYAYVILLIGSTIFINGVAFLLFCVLNLAFFPIIFVCNFRWAMYRYNKLSDNEEQDKS